MYAITGVTGHVGGAVARRILAEGEPVRAVVRDAVKGEAWSRQGADVPIADLSDRAALAEAFGGCRGAFILLPTVQTATDPDAYHRRLADSIADAVRDSGVPHVVLLSSVGADLPDGTGPVRWLHHLENQLRATNVRLTSIRSWHFQENVEALLGAAVQTGVYPVFGDSADIPTQMIATSDVGAAAAESLLSPPSAGEVIDLDGPQYTQRQVAQLLAAALGKPVQVITVPRPGWVDAMTGAGVPPQFARELAELYDAEQRDILHPKGDRRLSCKTELDQTLRHIVQTTPPASRDR